MRRVSASLIFGTTILFVSSAFGTETPHEKPIRVLLLSGQNNHNWRKTTPKIKSILEDSGRFVVEVEERPSRLTLKQLQSFQVILSNWNNFGASPEEDNDWPLVLKKSYVQFVRAGGGHVVVHAGSSSFYGWDEYHKLTLATWQEGRTDHGPRHQFNVRIVATDHPIGKGVGKFDYFGELWHRPGLQEDVTIIASAFSSKDHGGTGKQEPVAVAKQFGRGRSFTLLLGHDTTEMQNSGFTALLTRGTEWAATGKVAETKRRDRPSNPTGKGRAP